MALMQILFSSQSAPPFFHSLLSPTFFSEIGGRTTPYTWTHRGWESDLHFQGHVAVALRVGNSCVVARDQSYLEAILLQLRLQKIGLHVTVTSSDPTARIAYSLEDYPDETAADDAWFRARSGGRGRLSRADLTRIGRDLGVRPDLLEVRGG